MTADINTDERYSKELGKRSWLDKLESGVIAISRGFAMLAWGMLAAPVWLVMIVVALAFILLLTFARVFTARNFSIDRQLLRAVAGSYPNGFRYILAEFKKIREDLQEDETDVSPERSYLYSTGQSLLLLSLAISAYCIYKRIDLLKLPESAYVGATVIAVAALLMSWIADRRKKRI